jgi:hypothetical protein
LVHEKPFGDMGLVPLLTRQHVLQTIEMLDACE